MRLTPSQIGVRLICGQGIHRVWVESLVQRVREGRDFLVRITGKDFGYDLQAWHDHLKESREGGYPYGRNVVFPRIMQPAPQSPSCHEAVRTLTGPQAPPTIHT